MIDFIKNLPTPVLIASLIAVYIIIGLIVTLVTGMFDDGDESLAPVGALWIIALPMSALCGVAWLFLFMFRLGVKKSKHRRRRKKKPESDELCLGELQDEETR